MSAPDTSTAAVERLQAAARAVDDYRSGEWYFPGAASEKWGHVYERDGDSLVAETPYHDVAAFIAAANPRAVLALVAERDAARASIAARVAEAREAALREAAAYCHGRTTSRSYGSWADAFEAAEKGILALIPERAP